MRNWLAGLILAFGLPAFADPPPAKEALVVAPYPSAVAWKAVSGGAGHTTAAWIPADQISVTESSDALTVQTFDGSLDNITPEGLAMLVAKGGESRCHGLKVNGPKAQTENGYQVAYAQFYCTGYGDGAIDVDAFIKVIRGKDAMYVVQRIFRRPAEKDAVPGVRQLSAEDLKADVEAHGIADRFLVEQVQLCPLAEGNGPCPVPGAAPAGN